MWLGRSGWFLIFEMVMARRWNNTLTNFLIFIYSYLCLYFHLCASLRFSVQGTKLDRTVMTDLNISGETLRIDTVLVGHNNLLHLTYDRDMSLYPSKNYDYWHSDSMHSGTCTAISVMKYTDQHVTYRNSNLHDCRQKCIISTEPTRKALLHSCRWLAGTLESLKKLWCAGARWFQMRDWFAFCKI